MFAFLLQWFNYVLLRWIYYKRYNIGLRIKGKEKMEEFSNSNVLGQVWVYEIDSITILDEVGTQAKLSHKHPKLFLWLKKVNIY